MRRKTDYLGATTLLFRKASAGLTEEAANVIFKITPKWRLPEIGLPWVLKRPAGTK